MACQSAIDDFFTVLRRHAESMWNLLKSAQIVVNRTLNLNVSS